jgi:hypothetical protein
VTYLVVGLVLAAAVAVGVALLVRQSIGGGALASYVVPYAEADAEGAEFVGGGVWAWGVRASAPLVRLEIGPDHVRLGPSNLAWSFLIRSLAVPRGDLLSVAVVKRPFGVQAVRFSVVGGTFAFIGHVDAVLAAITTRWPSEEPEPASDSEPESDSA